jgi:hypothetical protein
MADTVGISHGVWEEILTEYSNIHHIAAKSVPRLLTSSKAAAHKRVPWAMREG